MKGGEQVRQTSTQFMDELLKDNVQKTPQGDDLGEKIASIIDAKMKEAMQKYTEALQTVNPPEESGNIERKGENENEEEHGEEGDSEDE